MAGGKIFINYRREDSGGYTRSLFDRLTTRFPNQVFMDVSALEPGVDFVEAIESAVGSCDALIVLIGKTWLTVVDARGHRRLDDPKDYVRIEIASALSRNVRVIPALVGGATMPAEGDLPLDLQPLTRRQALQITDQDWDHDVERLIKTLVSISRTDLEGLSHDTDLAPGSALAPRRESVRRSTLAIAGALLVLVLLTVGLVTGLAHSRAPTSTVAVPSGRASLAIFPFENRTGDTRNDPYCQDGADWVLVDVAKAPGLDVISRDRLLEAAGALQLTFSPCRPVIHAIEIAKQAGARYLLRGATVRMGAVIAVTVEIIEVDTGNVVAPEHEAGLTDKNFTDKLEHLGTQLCQDLQRTH